MPIRNDRLLGSGSAQGAWPTVHPESGLQEKRALTYSFAQAPSSSIRPAVRAEDIADFSAPADDIHDAVSRQSLSPCRQRLFSRSVSVTPQRAASRFQEGADADYSCLVSSAIWSFNRSIPSRCAVCSASAASPRIRLLCAGSRCRANICA